MTDNENKHLLRERQKEQEIFKAATAAALKALSGGEDVSVSFNAHEPIAARLPFSDNYKATKLPAIGNPDDKSQKLNMRAAADIRATHIAYHNAALHKSSKPDNPESALAWDALERARCESIGMRNLQGVKENLNQALNIECKTKRYDGIDNKDDCPFAEALYILGRSALSETDLPENAQNLQALWGKDIADKLGNETIADLIPHINDQQAFAQKARSLLDRLGLEGFEDINDEGLSPENNDDESADEESNEQDSSENDTKDQKDSEGLENPLTGEQEQEISDDSELQQADQEHQETAADDGANTDIQTEENGQSSEHAQGDANPLSEHGHNPNYRVYTTEFDEIIKAEELASPSDLHRLREMLDAYLDRYQSMITRLANRLQRKLMAQQQRNWKFDLEEGQIDSTRLSRIIANPSVPLSFKQEQEAEFKDTVLTLLLDNSGSMRGRPITISALCADILIRTLERCNIKTEVLGFTTRAWKGGRSRELWMENGRPDKPGRLNDIRHIIYKEADSPWRRTKRNLGLMLKEGLLKENIDGEALAWAHNRIARRPEERKIIMVISDGAPVDDSTLSSNPASLLEKDLHSVINKIEKSSKVELCAIGIGHDVTQYYKNSITITDVDQLAEALMHKLEVLFEK